MFEELCYLMMHPSQCSDWVDAIMITISWTCVMILCTLVYYIITHLGGNQNEKQ